MSEIFRFMTVRSVQLADSSSAIDLSTFLQPQPAAQGRRQAARANIYANPKLPSALNFADNYDEIATNIQAANFNPATTQAVVQAALGNTPVATWVQAQAGYSTDKDDTAVALIAAHLNPPSDDRIDTLATYARVMNMIDALAAGSPIADATTLNDYMRMVLLAPAGALSPTPYNPYVVPAGVADLQVVNQELLAYEKKEVSYIANVLKSESYNRHTIRFEKTDQTYTTTTDTTTQTEQDTESAQRYQLQTQAQNTIQDNSSLKFGISISASYGPSVQAKSNFDAASSQASTNSDSTSVTYAKDITTRSVSKVTQEVSQQQRLDIINSFKERIEHGFDNTGGKQNINGVYQYVDALYEVGVFNYGQRLLLDEIVPDPAALIRDAIRVANGGMVNAYNPPPITFGPSDLTLPEDLLTPNANLYPDIAQRANIQNAGGTPVDYTQAAETYQVADLKAPKDPYAVVAKTYTGSSQGGPVNDVVPIPNGYVAVSATVVASMAAQNGSQAYPNYPDPYVVTVQLGETATRFGNETAPASNSVAPVRPAWDTPENTPLYIPLNAPLGPGGQAVPLPAGALQAPGERGSIAVIVSGGNIAEFEVVIEILCLQTDEEFAQWQLNAFGQIYQSYLNLQSNYQQAVGQNQQSLAGTSYPGSSPDENTRITQIELKRQMISLITLRQFDPPAPQYSATTPYPVNAVVTYDGQLYMSLAAANTGNEPDTSAANWSSTNAPAYAPATTYAAGEPVTFNSVLYVSQQGNNTGNEPDTSPSWWATNPATYVDQNLPSWSGQGAPSTADEVNYSGLFQQAPLIRFMEEAFEWEEMQYVFYPYYWNQKGDWFDLALLEDPDYLFALFLRAGAARVVVPVRPGFEESFVYFLETGQPWDGGSPPQVVDSSYFSIAAEIAEQDDQPVTETLVGSTWTMSIPTTLTMLRSDDHRYPAWAPGTTYDLGSVVSYNGMSYGSIQGDNSGNQPDTSPSWWAPYDASLPSWTLDSNLNVVASN